MAAQTLMLVVLPNGLGPNGVQRVSLYLSPRLNGAPILGDFPDLLDWPDLIQRHGLHVTLKCGARSTSLAVARTGLRPDIWREIFKPQTDVAAYPRPDYDKCLVVSYPSSTALDYLKWPYQTAATSPAIPGERLFEVLLQDLVFRDGKESTLDQTLSELRVSLWDEQQGLGSTAAPAIAAATAAAALPVKPAGTRDMAERFALYQRLPPAPGRDALPSTTADFEKLLDFHKAIAALTGYPGLMRALGLVFDVELPAGHCQLSRPWYARCVGGAAAPVGRSFARLSCCPTQTEAGRKRRAEFAKLTMRGRELSVREVAMLRLARTHAVQAAVQALDLMYTDAGGAAIYTRNPLERCFRDIHAVTQHVSMNPANYEVSGRVLLGLDPDRALYRL